MKKNKEQDFLQAYEAFSDALFRYCFFKTGDRELAKDMVQDVYFKTWESLIGGTNIDNIKAFLYRAANNKIIDWYRKKKAISLDSLAEEGFDPIDKMADTSQKAEVEEAMKILSRLNQGDQDIITWRYIDELSVKEIAGIVSETENVVSVRLHRALVRLRNLLH